MKLLADPVALTTEFRRLLVRHSRVSFAVAWASVGFDAFNLLTKRVKKIKRAVIGTHFYQTHPGFIEFFAESHEVKFIMEQSDIFHPKIYLFESGPNDWAIIVGSANFTNGGFGRNREICITIDSSDDIDSNIRTFVENQIVEYWNNAKTPTAAERRRYLINWKKNKHKLADLAQSDPFPNVNSDRNVPSVLNMKWIEFFHVVQEDEQHNMLGRLDVLEAARDAFQRYREFRNIPEGLRQNVAGYRADPNISWGWFGHMKAARYFTSLVNRQPLGISEALDHIPLEGPVVKEQYLSFCNNFVNSFRRDGQLPKGHGLATATRLLAMKRPDYFICLDSANKAKISVDFHINIGHQNYEAYWDDIITRIQEMAWWNSPEPRDRLEYRVWKGRAAFLDAIYYDP